MNLSVLVQMDRKKECLVLWISAAISFDWGRDCLHNHFFRLHEVLYCG